MPERLILLERPAEQIHEAELLERVRAGEHDLFYELIRPYERRVYAAAFAILRNEADAEDVAQQALLKAFKHIRPFPGGGAVQRLAHPDHGQRGAYAKKKSARP